MLLTIDILLAFGRTEKKFVKKISFCVTINELLNKTEKYSWVKFTSLRGNLEKGRAE